MNTSQLDSLFCQYGYELKEQTLSYRVYLLHQGMYYGAEILMLDESDATDIQKRYSRLGYSAKIQHFANVKQAESYLFKGFFKKSLKSNNIESSSSFFLKEFPVIPYKAARYFRLS